jgi:hypothetical protein
MTIVEVFAVIGAMVTGYAITWCLVVFTFWLVQRIRTTAGHR